MFNRLLSTNHCDSGGTRFLSYQASYRWHMEGVLCSTRAYQDTCPNAQRCHDNQAARRQYPCNAGDDGGSGADVLLERWHAETVAGNSTMAAAARPNLLKRCIILVKAWSYYEARVLGAHHSLMSSYALEVMVLYVLLHYPARASTPFSLLCTYLQVFSAFDWGQNALTLHGPIPLAALGDGTSAGVPSWHGDIMPFRHYVMPFCQLIMQISCNAPLNTTIVTMSNRSSPDGAGSPGMAIRLRAVFA